MKKLIYIFLLLITYSSCDNGFEELNVNPTKPTQVDAKNKLTAVQLYTSGGRYENWRANLIYSSTMMQHFSSTAGYWSGDKYFRNAGYASSLMDRYYSDAVKNVVDLSTQLDEEGKPDEMKAIVKIMKVLIFHRLTDVYGDVPYSEAGLGAIQEILQPKYDRQSEIYPDMLNELETAAAALGTGTSEFGDADIIFNGDLAKWKKFANSMMLRLGLRLIKIDPAAAQAWATKAINGGVMESNADIVYIQHSPGPEGINKNGNGEVFSADGNMRLSKTFVDILENDPRLPILGARAEDGSTAIEDLKGLPNGLNTTMLMESTGEENTAAYAGPNRSIITGEDAPMFFQTYAEVEFMIAEAAMRWQIGGDPAEHYNNGVTAAMKMLSIYGAAAQISDEAVTTYLDAHPFVEATGMEQIATQYWVATFLNEYETFANWRRIELPVLTPINFSGNVTNGTIPRRLTYTESEKVDNKTSYDAAISAQGPDEFTTRVWWDAE